LPVVAIESVVEDVDNTTVKVGVDEQASGRNLVLDTNRWQA
jgi:hypothetical protein